MKLPKFRKKASRKPEINQVDVESSPFLVSSGQIKVDLVYRKDGVITIAGWSTAKVMLALSFGSHTITSVLFSKIRPDVARYFSLPDDLSLGFVLQTVDTGEIHVSLLVREDPQSECLKSKPIVIRDLSERSMAESYVSSKSIPKDLMPSDWHEFSFNSSLAREETEEPPQTPTDSDEKNENKSTAKSSWDQGARKHKALIVGASSDVQLEYVRDFSGDVYALNAAFFYLHENNLVPYSLVTGDRRFLLRHGLNSLECVPHLITFDYALEPEEFDMLRRRSFVETLKCQGRDGFSMSPEKGFFHGCSSFFLAAQYLLWRGYRTVETIGVKFPPPELYGRISGTGGHPEFVYTTQLKNLTYMSAALRRHGAKLICHDMDSNLHLFI